MVSEDTQVCLSPHRGHESSAGRSENVGNTSLPLLWNKPIRGRQVRPGLVTAPSSPAVGLLEGWPASCCWDGGRLHTGRAPTLPQPAPPAAPPRTELANRSSPWGQWAGCGSPAGPATGGPPHRGSRELDGAAHRHPGPFSPPGRRGSWTSELIVSSTPKTHLVNNPRTQACSLAHSPRTGPWRMPAGKGPACPLLVPQPETSPSSRPHTRLSVTPCFKSTSVGRQGSRTPVSWTPSRPPRNQQIHLVSRAALSVAAAGSRGGGSLRHQQILQLPWG